MSALKLPSESSAGRRRYAGGLLSCGVSSRKNYTSAPLAGTSLSSNLCDREIESIVVTGIAMRRMSTS